MTFADKWAIACWAGSILAAIVVCAGLLMNKKTVWRIGQGIGVIDLIFCVLYWFFP